MPTYSHVILALLSDAVSSWALGRRKMAWLSALGDALHCVTLLGSTGRECQVKAEGQPKVLRGKKQKTGPPASSFSP